MSKYLYGASVQGIQEFIFKTNRLKEIVGASEIIKNISSNKYKQREDKQINPISFENNFNPDSIIVNAAGNIKAIFNSKQDCENTVLEFPKMVIQNAYGISISQAVVIIEAETPTQTDLNELEKRLKIQRNRPSLPLDISINLMKLNPSTARPMVAKDQDRATAQKLAAYNQFLENNPRNKEFSDISSFSNSKNKIAVIHIDGNGLGKLIPTLKEKHNLELSEFSAKLDAATKKAFDDARDDTMSIRDIILGGDDVTVICSADNALSFTENFLRNFEAETEKSFTKLTACAGVAFCNEKYPFHYAVSLAEELCKVAKDHSKRESSALMFHNIQSSNFQSWNKFIEDELTIKNDKKTIRCDFGAYYLNKREGEVTIKDLIRTVEAYKCEGSPISRLRSWLSELYRSDTNAQNLLDRINKITQEKRAWNCNIMDKNLKFLNTQLSNDNLIIQKDNTEKTPIYDILQVLSATSQQGVN
jgi:CRISPR/Cas system-associated protein Cas10 (large subunit of type III CRISPR-Cas system)